MGQILRISAFINQWKKDRRVRTCITVAAVFVSALIQSYALQVFVRPAGIISGGFTGMAMLVERLGELKGLNIPMQVTMLLLNIPVAILCCKGISIRFTIFSLVQVFLSSIFLQIFNFSPIFTDEVLNVIFGGVIFGSAIVIAPGKRLHRRHGLYSPLCIQPHRAFHLVLCVFWKCCHVLFLRRYFWLEARGIFHYFPVYLHPHDFRFHHRYELVTLQATTIKGQEVVDAYISHFRHGMSCVEAMGGYSKKKMYLLNTVISAYEVNNAIHIMQEADEHIIINVLRTQQFVGRFYRAPLE